jgi:tetratricopeptide (TPR) repeat protein
MLKLFLPPIILTLFFAGCANLSQVRKEPTSLGSPEQAEVKTANTALLPVSPDLTTLQDNSSNDSSPDAEQEAQNEAGEAYAAGNELYLKGDKDRAINLYRRALSLNPDHAGAQEMLRRALNEKLAEVRLEEVRRAESSVEPKVEPKTQIEESSSAEEKPSAQIDIDKEDATQDVSPHQPLPQEEMREAFIGLGEDLHVILPADPTKGEWKASVGDPKKIDVVSALYAPPLPGSSAGTTGNVVYTLRPKSAGEATATFRFGSGATITKRVDYTIHIESAEGGNRLGGSSVVEVENAAKLDVGRSGSKRAILEPSDEDLAKEREAIMKRESEVIALEKTLAQRSERLIEKEKELSRKLNEIARKEERLLKREAEVAAREKELSKLRSAIAIREQDVARREKGISASSAMSGKLGGERAGTALKAERREASDGKASLRDREGDGLLSSRYGLSQDRAEREDLDQFNLGTDLLKERMYDESIPELNRAIEGSQDAGLKEAAVLAAGLALSGGGKYDEAIIQYRKLLDEFPGGKLRGQAQLQIAKALFEKGDPRGAIVEFKRAVIFYPDEVGVQSEALLGLAEGYRQAGEVELALKSVEELIGRFPDSPTAADAQFIMGDIYDRNLKVRDYHKALLAYRKLVERYGKSRWVERARQRIAHIEKNYL